MLSKRMEKAINEQINAEIFSAYLYYAMTSYFESMTLNGFAHWLRIQALEELTHAQKFVSYLNDRGARVHLSALEGPDNEWDSPLAAFEAVYEHEQKVTGLINKLMELAQQESDFATVNFLQWFIGEQVEEEAAADEMVQKLKLVDKTEGGLFLLDQEVNNRSFVLMPELTGLF
ncbi:MAG: ferritin [Myxococcota bacterium]|nr:ferritin [Myxococcota bacterium]